MEFLDAIQQLKQLAIIKISTNCLPKQLSNLMSQDILKLPLCKKEYGNVFQTLRMHTGRAGKYSGKCLKYLEFTFIQQGNM